MSELSATGKPKWAEIVPPLLCGLLAAACLMVVPYRPFREMPVALGVSLLLGGMALVFAWRQEAARYPAGQVEIRLVEHEGTTEPGLVIPKRGHLAACLVGVELAIGLFGCFALLTYLYPSRGDDAWTMRIESCLALVLVLIGAGVILGESLRGGEYLALLPSGIVSRLRLQHCSLPWGEIEQLTLVEQPKALPLGPVWIGFRFLDPERAHISTRLCRILPFGFDRQRAHLYLHMIGLTLSIRQIAALLIDYHQHPEKRAKIGTESGLTEVRAVLAQIKDR